jgi:flagellin
MSSGITLTAGVRQNLLALQNTADLLATTQNRLATGKKVNSALDNPSSYFTSQALSNRASDLNGLLDSIGQATQTLKSADNGLTTLTKLVQSAKSIATQAAQATKGTVTYTNITGTATIAADTTRAVGTVSAATAGTISVQAQAQLNSTGLGQLLTGDTLTFQLGSGSTVTATFSSVAADNTTNTFKTAADLITTLNTGTGASGHFAATDAVAVTDGAGGVKLQAADVGTNFTVGKTSVGLTAANFSNLNVASTVGDAFSVSDGTNTNTYYRTAAIIGTTSNTYVSTANLVTRVNAGTAGTNITASAVGNFLQLDSANNKSITVAGATGTAQGFAATTYTNNYNSTLAGLNGSLTVKIGANATHTVTLGTGNGQVSTRTGLNTALGAFTDVGGSVDAAGKVNFNPASSDDVTIGGSGSVLAAVGLQAGITTPTGTVVTGSAARTNLQSDYNSLLTQIDQLANDTSYNGINLLGGDNLKVVFNENGTSSLSITGVRFNAIGLGLSAISGTGFQDDHNVNATIATLDSSLASLRTQSAKFGSTLTTVQARQDFTKNLIGTLQTGADNLVLADSNEEGANLLALNTRQSLSTTALSLANQSSQAVLRLLG